MEYKRLSPEFKATKSLLLGLLVQVLYFEMLATVNGVYTAILLEANHARQCGET